LSFKNSIEDIETCLNQADRKIQQHQAVDLDLNKLQETLKQIRSNEIRPKLLELQEKAISLLEKTITFGDSGNAEDETGAAKSDEPTPVFNRLYQQDINTLDDATIKPSAIRILLVEDDLISQKLTVRLLSSLNTKTELAVSGRRALASLSSVKYDLILMDISLPDTNGIYILSQTKTEGHLNFDTPIIMLTGSKSKQIVAEALKNGAQGYVVKPLTKKTIQAIFEKHLPQLQ
jgi:CheY-like chemotaxis protein